MIKKIFLAIAFVTAFTAADIVATSSGLTGNTCMAAAPNDGTYTRTSSSVSVYTHEGHPKGSFSVYLHHGKRYIISIIRGSAFRAKADSVIEAIGM